MADESNKQELLKEIAGIDRDPRIVTYGGILRQDDATLITRGRGKGLKIYDELERDCHAYAVLQKRKYAIVAGEWQVDAASEAPLDVKAADLVRAQLEALPFDRICVGLLDAVLKGYAVGEVIWEVRNGEIAVKEIKDRDQTRFVFDTQGNARLLTADSMMEGEELPERKFIVHRFGGKAGHPYGLGLGTRLFWPVFFKRQGITFWLTFADKFGSPTAVGKYPPGSERDEQRKLLGALSALAHDTGVIIPEDMQINFLEAQRAGSVNTHESLARYMDEQISEAVLGETLTTNIGTSGSYAASNTHNEVREELRDADADMLSDTLNNTLLTWITDLNLPGATPPRLWRSYEEPEDLDKKSTRDKNIRDMGFLPTQKYIDETYGIGWEPVRSKDPATPEQDPPPPAAAAFADPIETDAMDQLTDEIDDAAAPAMDVLIGEIRAIVEQADSLDEVAERLIQLYPDLDAQPLSRAMAAALSLAELQGRSEIANPEI